MKQWRTVLLGSAALGLVGLATTVATRAQVLDHNQFLYILSQTLRLLTNSGTAWAGIVVWAGWVLRRPAAAAMGGIVAGETALLVHYVVGVTTGLFTAQIFSENLNWFAASLITGAPLGLIGVIARQGNWLGLMARLFVPIGAVLEPVVRHRVPPPPNLPWQEAVVHWSAGVCLILIGSISAFLVIKDYLRHAKTSGISNGLGSQVAA